MRRVPSGVAVLALLAVAAAAIGGSLFAGSTPFGQTTSVILLDVRLGRAVLAFLAGASLAASGVVFQGLFRNPLADPFVAGVSGGAALGAVAMVVLGVQSTVLGLGSSAIAAFAGGLGAAALAYRIAQVRGRVPVASLLLAGFAIGSFCGAVVSILLLFNSRSWGEVVQWLMGFINDTNPWARVAVLAPCLLAALAVIMVFARDLDVMLLGEEPASQLGVDVERSKRWLLAAGTVAASAAVATCGIVGFVGLIVPHLLRSVVGPRHRALLPVAVLGGGVLLVLADVAARLVSPGHPLPVGAVTSLLGAPFFAVLLRRKTARA
jgi:iron complex transport system permease protein